MRHLTIGRFKSKNKQPRRIKDENGPLMLQTWNLLVFVARLRKKNIILWRTLTKIVEKIKVTKLKYLITAWLHSNNPLQRKHARRKLVFTVAVLLKGNRSSFSKQLGINCTSEQIGLFSYFHEWLPQPRVEIRKSSICSQVQLISNCFEKEERFPFNNTATVNTSFRLGVVSL